jgi:hypothetical protein
MTGSVRVSRVVQGKVGGEGNWSDSGVVDPSISRAHAAKYIMSWHSNRGGLVWKSGGGRGATAGGREVDTA